MASTATVRAGIYARLSRDRDGTETATGRQIDDCARMVESRGWTEAGRYADVDLSAFSAKVQRPEYTRLLQDVRDRRIDVVVAWKMDRLLRRPRDFETLWEACEAAGVQLATVKDGIDSTTPMIGTMLPRLMTMFAEMESVNLSVREKRKHEETAAAGKRSGGGHRPFGLTKDWSEVVPEEAERTRKAVDRILDGASIYSIAAQWNADGIHTPTGKQWTVQHLRSMLASPRLAGLRQHHGQIVGRGGIPAIVDEAKHERLRAILSDPSRRRETPGRFLLSGLLRCGKCGGPLYMRRRHKDKKRFYGCERVTGGQGCGGVHIVAEPLEALIKDLALRAVDGPALRNALNSAADDDSRAALDAVQADQAALEDLTHDRYVSRVVDHAAFLSARKALEDRIAANRASAGRQKGRGVLHELIGARGLAERVWDERGLDWQRSLLDGLLERVIVHPADYQGQPFAPSRVEPVWRY